MEELLYWFRPYILYALGFFCGGLDHPIKWMSVCILISISLYIAYARFRNNRVTYEEIQLKGGVRGTRTKTKRTEAFA